MSHLSQAIKYHSLRVLDAVGLGVGARHLLAYLRATGFTPWKPLVPQREFYDCIRAALKRLRETESTDDFGDYLEFGVSRGTSMACVYRALHDEGLRHVRLIGFDSFEGMPPEAAGQGWEPGRFHSTLNATRRYLLRNEVDLTRVILIRGWFKETLTPETRVKHAIQRASLIMVDCDIYSASKEALSFSEPHLRKHAVIIFDDWDAAPICGEIGQKQAFEEFLAEHPDLIAEPLAAYGQARAFFITRLTLPLGPNPR